MLVLGQVFGPDASQLIFGLDIVGADLSSLTSSWMKEYRSATCLARGLEADRSVSQEDQVRPPSSLAWPVVLWPV